MRRRRLTRRDKRSKQKKVIVMSVLCLLLVMTAGYAAFQTNLSITAKGNIKEKPNCEIGGIKVNTVTEGDGLYKDTYEENRCVYKGSNPNNYITFNGEIWRIIAKETDGTYKILRDGVLADRAFDSKGNRDKGSKGAGGTYCANTSSGCNAWSSTANMVGSPAEFVNGNFKGTVLKDSEMLTYLNGDYYNSLTSAAQSQIVSHDYNVGGIEGQDPDLNSTIEDEKAYKWNGKVGLISASDYIRANSNISTCGSDSLQYNNYSTCTTTNWIHNNDYWWTLSPKDTVYNGIYVSVNNRMYSEPSYAARGVRPSLFLNSNITLSGDGTKDNPYIIAN